jgi:ankyrin repeat protein
MVRGGGQRPEISAQVVIHSFILAARHDLDSAEGLCGCRRCGLLTGSSDADVNEQTKSGMTPLMCAVKVLGPKDGDDGIVSYLLESKANANLQDVMGDTALHIACCSKVFSRSLFFHHPRTPFL